ncbi:hypothetical protein D068_cds19480 [Bacillus atrophaeus UCMB-5137]|nr:hypothetical protein D068_cds19480 [Bacillus atrophaeus UCMB-5137]
MTLKFHKLNHNFIFLSFICIKTQVNSKKIEIIESLGFYFYTIEAGLILSVNKI